MTNFTVYYHNNFQRHPWERINYQSPHYLMNGLPLPLSADINFFAAHWSQPESITNLAKWWWDIQGVLTHWLLCWQWPPAISVDPCLTSHVITFDQSWHDLYSSSLGKDLSNDAQIIEPEISWKFSETCLNEWKPREQNCLRLHMATPC